MKKPLKFFLAFSSVLLMLFSSCKKDGAQVVSTVGSAGTLTASTATPALSLATSANNAVTFNFAATPVTGYQAAVTYTIQIDKKGNNFASAREITATAPSTNVSVAALNTVLLNMALPTGTSTQVDVRVKSLIAANATPVYSNTINLTVTPYTLTSYIYVPGGYQGWDPTKVDVPSLASPTSNGIYDGTVVVPVATTDFGFKITPAQSWAVSYGAASSSTLSLTGGNLTFPSAGTFKLHVDMNALTYTISK
ncbi:MAG: SusE domain-containing protein [Janthinobacterium lividum]